MKKLTILLFSILICFHSYADYQEGKDAYLKGDYTTVFNEWQPLAEQGHAEAQSSLAWMYFKVKG